MREIASVEEQAKPAFVSFSSEVTDFFTIDGNGLRWGTDANSTLRCSTPELHRHLEPTTGFEPMTTRLLNEVTVYYTTSAKCEIENGQGDGIRTRTVRVTGGDANCYITTLIKWGPWSDSHRRIRVYETRPVAAEAQGQKEVQVKS
jgi:hypothetical protein